MIKNICEKSAEYDVNIETLSTSTLSEDYLRIKLDDDNSYILGTTPINDSSTYINDNVKGSRTIASNLLLKNESKTYNLRMWIDEDSTVEQSADKYYASKVVVIAKLRKNPYNTITLHTNGGLPYHMQVICY